MSEELPDYITRHEDGSLELKLEHPVELKVRSGGGQAETKRTESIRFREPLGKDFSAMDGKEGFTALKAMAANLSGEPVALFDRLKAVDFAEAMDIVGRFTKPSRGTGEASSETSS